MNVVERSEKRVVSLKYKIVESKTTLLIVDPKIRKVKKNRSVKIIVNGTANNLFFRIFFSRISFDTKNWNIIIRIEIKETTVRNNSTGDFTIPNPKVDEK